MPANINVNHAVIVVKGHAGTEQVQEYVLSALAEKHVSVDKSVTLRAIDALDNPKISRLNRMAFSFLDTVYVFAVSWDSSQNKNFSSWKDFRENFVGDNDSPQLYTSRNPSEAPKNSLRAKIAAKHEELGLVDGVSADNNIIYCSPSAIAAVIDRQQWLGQEFEEDPFAQLVIRDLENGYEVLRRFVRDVFMPDAQNRSTTEKGSKKSTPPTNVFTHSEGFDTKQCVALIKSEDPFFVDCVDDSRKLGARRSTMRVTKEAPLEDTVYFDTEMRSACEEVKKWVRIGDLYPIPKDGELFPNDASPSHLSQGVEDECTLLGAIALLVERHPKIIENLFVSKEVRTDGKYTFQFYRWDKWERVEIDDALPCDEDGKTLLYARSPTQHWWPLLLEKAYAKFYGGYSALHGGILSEALHDLTAKPVESYVLTEEFVRQGAIPDFNEPSFWLNLFKDVEEGKLVVSIPASRGDGSDGGPMKEDAETLGFEPGHGYAAMGIKKSGSGKGIENLYVKLHNPYAELGYQEEESVAELGTEFRADGVRDSFWVPVTTLLQITQTIFVCRIKGVEDHPYVHENRWEGLTAGGPPSSVSWRNNPIFIVKNTSKADVKAMVVLKQRDQRKGNHESIMGAWNYLQVGLVAVRNEAEGGQYPTPYITNNLYKPFHRGVYLNQREVCDAITFTAGSLSYIVPSALSKEDTGDFLLAVYLPQGTSAKEVTVESFHADVDHIYPLRRELIVPVKEKAFTDLVLEKESEVHVLLRQRKDKSQSGNGGSDVSTDIHVAVTIFNKQNEKVEGMKSGLSYKENAVIAKLAAGRYGIAVVHAKGTEQLEADLFVAVHPKANGVLAPHRDFVTEADERDEAEEELKEQAADEARRKEQLARRKASEDAAAQRKKEAEEADKERKRLAAIEAEETAKAESEKKRLAEEAASKKRQEKEAAEQKENEAKAAKEKQIAEEAEKKRKEKEEADAKSRAEKEARKAEEAEKKRIAQEEADAARAEKEARKAEEAEKKKKEQEEAEASARTEKQARKAEEAEKKRKEQEEADAARAAKEARKAEEAERKKREQAEAEASARAEREARKMEEAEKKRVAQEEAKRQKDEDKKRKAEEEDLIRQKVAAFKKQNDVKPSPRPPAGGAPAAASPRSGRARVMVHSPVGADGKPYSDKAPKLPRICGFGSSSPRNL